MLAMQLWEGWYVIWYSVNPCSNVESQIFVFILILILIFILILILILSLILTPSSHLHSLFHLQLSLDCHFDWNASPLRRLLEVTSPSFYVVHCPSSTFVQCHASNATMPGNWHGHDSYPQKPADSFGRGQKRAGDDLGPTGDRKRINGCQLELSFTVSLEFSAKPIDSNFAITSSLARQWIQEPSSSGKPSFSMRWCRDAVIRSFAM